ncbi:MAG TPA: hypothetical protein VFS08_18265 [Gemmatimonadaceae bacterium]|nr:hypothetical protein [Gemmatimonadaceae bacterium]
MHRDDTPPDPALDFVHVLRSLRELAERRPLPAAACERQARACARLAAAAELELDELMALTQAVLEPRLADVREVAPTLVGAMIQEYLVADERRAGERPAAPSVGEQRRAAQ